MPDFRRLRFRLPHWGWFLFATAILGGVCGALAVWLPYHREQQIIQKVKSWGGEVLIWENGGPNWLRRLLGDKPMKVFDRVWSVDLDGRDIADTDLSELGGLTNLRYLHLHDTNVTDAGLARLGALMSLKNLVLSKTAVTDVGLAHLRGLKNLGFLDLHSTTVTDAGLAGLSEMKKLEILLLDGTAVTDDGVTSLKKALPDCDIVR